MAVKARTNITCTYDSLAITNYLNTVSVEAIVNAIDTTHLGSTGEEKIAGTGGWKVPVGGDWAKALDDKLGVDVVTPPSTLKTLVVVIGASGSQVTYTWTTNAFVGGYTVTAADPNGKLTWSGTLEVSGAPGRA